MKDKAGESNEGFAAIQNLLTRTYNRMMMVKMGGGRNTVDSHQLQSLYLQIYPLTNMYLKMYWNPQNEYWLHSHSQPCAEWRKI